MLASNACAPAIANKNDMSDRPCPVNPFTTIYPAYCFSASPTFNRWVKLTAVDIHALRQERHFEGQNIYFHLNHPIRYVYVIGVVVAVDFINAKFIILTIDDGSGATIDVKITTLKPTTRSIHTHSRTENNNTRASEEEHVSEEENHEDKINKQLIAAENQIRQSMIPTTSETQTPNLTVTSVIGDHTLHLYGNEIDVGSVVKAKGTLHLWRGSFQLTLLRAFLVRSTEEEVNAWLEYASFANEVLARPWILSDEELKRLETADNERISKERDSAREKADRDRKRAQKRKEYEERRKRREEKAEKKRLKEAMELDGNPLDHKDWKPYIGPRDG